MERAPSWKTKKRQKKLSHTSKLKKQKLLEERKKKKRVHVSVKIDNPFLVLDEEFVKKAAPRRIQKVYRDLIAKTSELKYREANLYGGFSDRRWWYPRREGLSEIEIAFLKSMTKKEFVARFFIVLDYLTKEGALAIAKSIPKSYFKPEIKNG